MCETLIVEFVTGLCEVHHVDTEIGQLHHYRKECYDDHVCPPAERAVRDDRVWAHLETVISNSNSAIKAIDFE